MERSWVHGSSSIKVNGTTFDIPPHLSEQLKKPPTVDVITSSSLTSQQPPMIVPSSQLSFSTFPVLEAEKEVLVEEAATL
jgi:hypothetical protein